LTELRAPQTELGKLDAQYQFLSTQEKLKTILALDRARIDREEYRDQQQRSSVSTFVDHQVGDSQEKRDQGATHVDHEHDELEHRKIVLWLAHGRFSLLLAAFGADWRPAISLARRRASAKSPL
jgi:hypothetical protein